MRFIVEWHDTHKMSFVIFRIIIHVMIKNINDLYVILLNIAVSFGPLLLHFKVVRVR